MNKKANPLLVEVDKVLGISPSSVFNLKATLSLDSPEKAYQVNTIYFSFLISKVILAEVSSNLSLGKIAKALEWMYL